MVATTAPRLAVLTKRERVGVARIRVPLGVLRAVVVAEERVADPRFCDLSRGVERRVRLLARALFAEPRVLSAVEESEVHARTLLHGTRPGNCPCWPARNARRPRA